MNRSQMSFTGKYRESLWQFIKFNIVGVANTAMDFGVFFLVNAAIGDSYYKLVQVISYSWGAITSYIWNKYWTFKNAEKPNPGEVLRLIEVNVVSLGVSLLALLLFKEKMGMGTPFSKILATIFSVLVNFAGNKFWVFRSNQKINTFSGYSRY
ncbi:MAG: GtrA family protein [Atribacterota bacterium]